jgi:hypothetical protein
MLQGEAKVVLQLGDNPEEFLLLDESLLIVTLKTVAHDGGNGVLDGVDGDSGHIANPFWG